MMDLYQKLGVAPTATDEEIQQAYRKAAKKAHPDAGGSPDEFNALTLARDTLSDPDSRAVYDQTGQTPHEDPKLPAAILLIRALACECAAQSQTQNLAGAIREALTNQVSQLKSAARKYQASIDQVEKRWHADDIKKQVLDEFESRKLSVERQGKVAETARELMKDCKQDGIDAPPEGTIGNFSGWRNVRTGW